MDDQGIQALIILVLPALAVFSCFNNSNLLEIQCLVSSVKERHGKAITYTDIYTTSIMWLRGNSTFRFFSSFCAFHNRFIRIEPQIKLVDTPECYVCSALSATPAAACVVETWSAVVVDRCAPDARGVTRYAPLNGSCGCGRSRFDGRLRYWQMPDSHHPSLGLSIKLGASPEL